MLGDDLWQVHLWLIGPVCAQILLWYAHHWAGFHKGLSFRGGDVYHRPLLSCSFFLPGWSVQDQSVPRFFCGRLITRQVFAKDWVLGEVMFTMGRNFPAHFQQTDQCSLLGEQRWEGAPCVGAGQGFSRTCGQCRNLRKSSGGPSASTFCVCYFSFSAVRVLSLTTSAKPHGQSLRLKRKSSVCLWSVLATMSVCACFPSLSSAATHTGHRHCKTERLRSAFTMSLKCLLGSCITLIHSFLCKWPVQAQI